MHPLSIDRLVFALPHLSTFSMGDLKRKPVTKKLTKSLNRQISSRSILEAQSYGECTAIAKLQKGSSELMTSSAYEYNDARL